MKKILYIVLLSIGFTVAKGQAGITPQNYTIDAGSNSSTFVNNTVFTNTLVSTNSDYAGIRGNVNTFPAGKYVYTTDKGKEGYWIISTTDFSSADNGGTILVDAGGHRWIRIFSGPAILTWFNAKAGDPSWDNSVLATNVAIKYLNSIGGGILLIPAGDWYQSHEDSLMSNVIVTGQGLGTRNIGNFPSRGFRIWSNDQTKQLKNARITNMYISRDGTNSDHGVIFSNADNLEVDHVTIHMDPNFVFSPGVSSGGALGISCFDTYADHPSTNVKIHDNHIVGGHNFGVQFGAVTGGTIVDNTFDSCHREVIGLEAYGLGPNFPINQVSGITVTGNTITSGKSAVDGSETGLLILTNSSRGAVYGNTVTGNTIIGDGQTAGQSGITMLGVKGNVVNNNAVSHTGGDGISLGFSAYGINTGNTVSFNTIDSCGEGGAMIFYSGMKIKDSRNNTFKGNIIYGPRQKYGITTNGSSENNIFEGNNLVGNAVGSDSLITRTIGTMWLNNKTVDSAVIYEYRIQSLENSALYIAQLGSTAMKLKATSSNTMSIAPADTTQNMVDLRIGTRTGSDYSVSMKYQLVAGQFGDSTGVFSIGQQAKGGSTPGYTQGYLKIFNKGISMVNMDNLNRISMGVGSSTFFVTALNFVGASTWSGLANYGTNYGSLYGNRSLTDKGYVDSAIAVNKIPAHVITVVTTGATVSTSRNVVNIINPAGTLGVLTVNFPPSPQDGDRMILKFKQAITSLSFGAGVAINAPTTAVANQEMTFTYDLANLAWY